VWDSGQYQVFSLHDHDGHTPCLKADNYLHFLIIMVDDNVDVEIVAAQFL
jgi:hypothetical protein